MQLTVHTAFDPNSASNKNIPPDTSQDALFRTIKYRNDNNITAKVFLAIVLTGDININNNNNNNSTDQYAFANGTTSDRSAFVTNVINYVYKFGLDGVDLEYPDRYNCGTWMYPENFIPLVDELSSALAVSKKELSITVGAVPIKGLNASSVSFVNVMPFKFNEVSQIANVTEPSTTLDQISSAMSDWSKVVDPKKLVLGVSTNGIVELTVPVKEEDFNVNGTVPRDIDSTIPSNAFNLNADSIKDSNLSSYIDQCTFKEDHSLKVSSCFELRKSADNPSGLLNSSCTASSGWTRKFDIGYNATFLYSLYNTSSSTPLSRYYYVTYEDYQSIQYKLKLIIDNSYGGIALSPLTNGCDDLVNAVTSAFPVTGYSLPNYDSTDYPYGYINYYYDSSASMLRYIIIVIAVIIGIAIFCGGGYYYYNSEVVVGTHSEVVNNNYEVSSGVEAFGFVAVQRDRAGNVVVAEAFYAES